MNHSPRIHQLEEMSTHYTPLDSSCQTDIAIVGGGIAGMMTAYYILKETDKQVVLLEGYKLAHGATGHNAGQVTSYFERPFKDIVAEYGAEMACQAQQDIFLARDKLAEVLDYTDIPVPYHTCIGYDGMWSRDALIDACESTYLLNEGNVQIDSILVAQEWLETNTLPERYRDIYLAVPQAKILELLETHDTKFIALEARKAGCLNSALFVRHMAQRLTHTYQERCKIYEHSPVSTLHLHRHHAELIVNPYDGSQEKQKSDVNALPNQSINAQRVILCTNGFEHIEIINHYGKDVDTKFHENVEGIVGYMCGYLDQAQQKPAAICYDITPYELETATGSDVEAYYYLTRRPFELSKGHHTLVCVGGPESALEHKLHYDKDYPQSDSKQKRMDEYIRKTYAPAPAEIHYAYRRHGLMGYTQNTLRLIGPDPFNTVLMYNLGCNGVGILPSIHGGRKTAQFVLGKVSEPSIFDPQ